MNFSDERIAGKTPQVSPESGLARIQESDQPHLRRVIRGIVQDPLVALYSVAVINNAGRVDAARARPTLLGCAAANVSCR
ncbi:MAG: hypothetical protein OXN89_15040 [Bryobacterales bacterium]|nr:hypothetical protein [Bryobacterales bacterium]